MSDRQCADYFADQTDPDDVATLEFSIDTCAKLQNLDMATQNPDAQETTLGSLGDANLGVNGLMRFAFSSCLAIVGLAIILLSLFAFSTLLLISVLGVLTARVVSGLLR